VTNPPEFENYYSEPRVYARPAEPGQGRRIDQGRLWTGGIMAAVVAALVAVVGLLLARGIADVPVLVERKGQLVDASTWWYAGAAALGAILATVLLDVLLMWAPKPYTFFGWIIGLVTAIATLLPYAYDAELAPRVATSAINLAIGICIGSIVAGVGRSAAYLPDRPAR
jgi:hypothetical protein